MKMHTNRHPEAKLLPKDTFFLSRTEWWGYQTVRKTLKIFIAVYAQYRRVTNRQTDRLTNRRTEGRTDGQTPCRGIVRAMHTRRAVKIAKCLYPTRI